MRGPLLNRPGARSSLAPGRAPATAETWTTEHLALRVGVRIVDSRDEAVEHIEQYGSHHRDAIVTENVCPSGHTYSTC